MSRGDDRRHFGHLRRRSSGNWQATYKVDGLTYSLGTFDYEADAFAALSEVETSVSRGTWIDAGLSEVTLAAYATTWLNSRHDLAERTREAYGYLLEKFILPELGRQTLRELSPSEVRAWNARHAAKHPSTAAKAYRALASVLRTAVINELIVASPCRVRGAGTERPAERPIATVDEIQRLVELMPRHLKIAIDLAVWCQLRRGEILGLQRRDVDLELGVLRIDRSRTFLTSGVSITKEPKTNAGRRSIVMPERIAVNVKGHLAEFVEPRGEAPLLVGRDQLPISAIALQRAWHKARGQVGRTDLHFHDLRHTGLTLAAATGATGATTAELMRRAGHASPDTALPYQRATLDRDRTLAERLQCQLASAENRLTGQARVTRNVESFATPGSIALELATSASSKTRPLLASACFCMSR